MTEGKESSLGTYQTAMFEGHTYVDKGVLGGVGDFFVGGYVICSSKTVLFHTAVVCRR